MLVAENGLTLEGRTAGTKAASIINRKGGIIEARSGTLTIRAESLKNITGATFDTKTTAYANEVVAGAYPPDWLKGGFSKYWAAGASATGTSSGTLAAARRLCFVPHPERSMRSSRPKCHGSGLGPELVEGLRTDFHCRVRPGQRHL